MMTVDGSLLVTCIGGAILAALIIYHTVAGYYHYRYYVLRRDEPEMWKCQPNRFLTPKLHLRSILLGSGNLILAGVLTGSLIYGMIEGTLKTAIYTDVAEYGWAYTLGMTVVLFVMMDYIDYLVHRMLHIKFIYRRVHFIHHRFVAVSPYVATALHPIELLALQAASFAPLFFVPFHAASVVGVLIYILIFNIIDHSGVKLVSALPWQPPSVFHDDHHVYFHVNFGQHLMIWDRLHGTLRRQNRYYGKDVFGGRGVRENGSPETKPDRFVNY